MRVSLEASRARERVGGPRGEAPGIIRKAGYGNRTRLTGLGSQDITTMLSPRRLLHDYRSILRTDLSLDFEFRKRLGQFLAAGDDVAAGIQDAD
jgi:hypothetical protein